MAYDWTQPNWRVTDVDGAVPSLQVNDHLKFGAPGGDIQLLDNALQPKETQWGTNCYYNGSTGTVVIDSATYALSLSGHNVTGTLTSTAPLLTLLSPFSRTNRSRIKTIRKVDVLKALFAAIGGLAVGVILGVFLGVPVKTACVIAGGALLVGGGLSHLLSGPPGDPPPPTWTANDGTTRG